MERPRILNSENIGQGSLEPMTVGERLKRIIKHPAFLIGLGAGLGVLLI